MISIKLSNHIQWIMTHAQLHNSNCSSKNVCIIINVKNFIFHVVFKFNHFLGQAWFSAFRWWRIRLRQQLWVIQRGCMQNHLFTNATFRSNKVPSSTSTIMATSSLPHHLTLAIIVLLSTLVGPAMQQWDADNLKEVRCPTYIEGNSRCECTANTDGLDYR